MTDSLELRRVSKLLRKHVPHSKPGTSKIRKPGLKLLSKPSKHTSLQNELQKVEFSSETISLCAEMSGISNLPQNTCSVLRKHINQVAHILIHSSLRIMEQNRRGMPQPSDIDASAITMGLEVPYGTSTAEFLPIRGGGRTTGASAGGKPFFIRPDKEIDIKALLLREPASVVYDISVIAHWLAIYGKQPIVPQNPPPDYLARMNALNGCIAGLADRQSSGEVATGRIGSNYDSNSQSTGGTYTCKSVPFAGRTSVLKSEETISKLPINSAAMHPRHIPAIVKERRPHEVSQEVMLYFCELTEACVGASESRRHEALENAAVDTGLQPILPHLVIFITEGVRVNVSNNNLAILIYLMRLVKALIDNPHLCLEPYLHLLVPTVTTCVLCRQLCAKPITDNHWALRDFAAKQLATLCQRYTTPSNELHNRVTRELSRALCAWIDAPTRAPMAGDIDVRLDETSEGASSIDNSRPVGPPGPPSYGGVQLGGAARSLATLYGLLTALCELGPASARTLLLPLLPGLARRLNTGWLRPLPAATSNTNPTSVPTIVASPGQSDSSAGILHPVSSILPADMRALDALQALVMNRLAPIVYEWRIRQNLSITLEAYQSAYGCLSNWLYARVPQSSYSSPINQASSQPGQSSSSLVGSLGQLSQSSSARLTTSVQVCQANQSRMLGHSLEPIPSISPSNHQSHLNPTFETEIKVSKPTTLNNISSNLASPTTGTS